jgi:glutamyl-tRNA reductase
MKIAVLGLNHKTAPVDIREKLAFSAEHSAEALGQLKIKFPNAEFVILSTCNRTELYYAADNAEAYTDDLAQFLCDFCGVPLADFKDFLYVHTDARAVEHLLTVASSLDSLIVGEAQIVAQVKESYRLATTSIKSTGKVLNSLFHCAFATSKEVYSITSIAQRRVSVAGVAIELAKQLLEHISSASVAVIGAGEMAELLIRHLVDLDCQNITVFNRTLNRAERMAEHYHINAANWSDLKPAMQQVDIIVAAAATDDYLFDKSFVESNRTGPLLIIDIAVPRNFHPDVGKLEDVYLYSIDDLGQVVQDNIQARQEDIGQAREIIADNVESFMDWFALSDIGPLIGKLRKKFHQISRSELDHFFAGENNMTIIQRQKTEAAVDRIVNKLVHRFIKNFHNVAQTHGPDEAADMIESIIKYEDR